MDYFGIFAKHWQPGKVKTRLARKIGESSAAEAYHLILSHLASKLGAVADERFIAFSPPESLDSFKHFVNEIDSSGHSTDGSPTGDSSSTAPKTWQLTPQSSGGLGERMSHFFHTAFERGAKRVLLIGSDCPDVSPAVCEQAYRLLSNHDAVLGPTGDGGYYLVGMSGHFVDLFSDIEFSTTSVLSNTIEKLNRHQIKFAQLQPLNDIDELEDLHRYTRSLESKVELEIENQAEREESSTLLNELSKLIGDGAGS